MMEIARSFRCSHDGDCTLFQVQLAQTAATKWEVVYEMVALPDQHTTLSNNCNSDNERYYIVHVLIAYILT